MQPTRREASRAKELPESCSLGRGKFAGEPMRGNLQPGKARGVVVGLAPAPTADLGPGVAQAHGAVEHEPAGRGIRVAAEVALPF